MSIKIIVGYLIGIIILIGIIVFVGSREATSTVSKDDPNRPVAVVSQLNYDFGAMKNSDIRTKTFEVKNSGKSDLELTNVSTSCDCTYVYVTASGQKSPKFTMHGTTTWKGVVKPNQTAQVEVVYEPAIMPVQGKVERIVTITTNDPEHEMLEFKVSAEVSD